MLRLKASSLQCTVQSTVTVVATRTGCLVAIAEWVVFEANLQAIDGLSNANSWLTFKVIEPRMAEKSLIHVSNIPANG